MKVMIVGHRKSILGLALAVSLAFPAEVIPEKSKWLGDDMVIAWGHPDSVSLNYSTGQECAFWRDKQHHNSLLYAKKFRKICRPINIKENQTHRRFYVARSSP